MSTELTENANGRVDNDTRDTLFLLGGAAMVIFGAGLILSTPVVRRQLGDVGVGGLLGAALPDFQRYLKLRGM
jgi:hypothetical protein